MVKKNGDVRASGPLVTKKGAALPRATQSMTEDYNGNRSFFGWEVNPNGDVALCLIGASISPAVLRKLGWRGALQSIFLWVVISSAALVIALHWA